MQLYYSSNFISSAVGKTTFCREIVGAYCTQRGGPSSASTAVPDDQACDDAPFIRPAQVVAVSEDCVVKLFESVGYGDEYDYQQHIQLIKSYLLKTHVTYNDLEWNKMTEQVLYVLLWHALLITYRVSCIAAAHTLSLLLRS